jgi:hypothetical protein
MNCFAFCLKMYKKYCAACIRSAWIYSIGDGLRSLLVSRIFKIEAEILFVPRTKRLQRKARTNVGACNFVGSPKL